MVSNSNNAIANSTLSAFVLLHQCENTKYRHYFFITTACPTSYNLQPIINPCISPEVAVSNDSLTNKNHWKIYGLYAGSKKPSPIKRRNTSASFNACFRQQHFTEIQETSPLKSHENLLLFSSSYNSLIHKVS